MKSYEARRHLLAFVVEVNPEGDGDHVHDIHADENLEGIVVHDANPNSCNQQLDDSGYLGAAAPINYMPAAGHPYRDRKCVSVGFCFNILDESVGTEEICSPGAQLQQRLARGATINTATTTVSTNTVSPEPPASQTQLLLLAAAHC